MAPLRSLAVLSLTTSVSSFSTGVKPLAMRPDVASGQRLFTSPSLAATTNDVFESATTNDAFEAAATNDVFEEGVQQFNDDFPVFASWGWGPSVQAEKWNGRHAMFGWVMLCLTSYTQGHHLIPNPGMALEMKQWGSLAIISGTKMITNERAVYLFANVHFLIVSLFATIAPLGFWDRLLIDPEEDEPVVKPYGAFPEYRWGITPEAELINGRLAMFGIIAVVTQSLITGKPIFDVVNQWLGGAYY